MKKHINHYWLALALLLPALHACTDDNEAMPGEEPGTAGTPTVVSASIGDEPDTRAQVQWGTQDAADGELFMWNNHDSFKAYNITAAEATSTAYTFNIDGNYNEAQPGNQADFICTDFSAAAGNKIAAFYFVTAGLEDEATVTDLIHGKGIQSLVVSSQAPQQQTATPGNADLDHLKYGLCMYAIGEAGENNTISSLSFHHLSALFRFTIRNQQGTDAKVKKIGISFNGQKVICQKKTVTLWANNAMTYTVDETDKQDATELSLKGVNGINHATIASGSSYDCFLPVMPVAEEGNAASSPVITVTDESDNSISVTIDGFNGVEIKAGMRYWFDLTVKADGTLVQTFKTDYTWYAQDNNATEFSLSTPGELRALANLVNGTEEALNAASASGPVNFEGKTIRLANDISGFMTDWKPIGKLANPFKGTFDGGGHSITGVYFNQYFDDYAGLFGCIDGGTVRNLRVSGRWATTAINVGGIVGYLINGSTVENCIFSGEVSGTSNVGGIAGYFMSARNDNRISGCYTKGKVTATNRNAGGIAGSTISSSIDGCYSEAEVTAANKMAGGIAGQNGNSSFTHCYATGKVSGANYIGGIVGINGSPSSVTGCIALNPGLMRTGSPDDIMFGRISGDNSGTVTSCAAFQGMTIKDAGGNDIYTIVGGEHGNDLAIAECLAKDTYTILGFTEPTATEPGWAFDPATPWTYLPWNPAFESFPGISAADYRISVPAHLSGNGTVN